MAESGSQESDMLFPILDRNAPVVDRIRNRDRRFLNRFRNGDGKEEPISFVDGVVEAVKSDTEDVPEIANRTGQSVKEQIADRAGVPVDAISDEIPSKVSSIIKDIEGEESVLTDGALEELRSEGDNEDDEEQDSDSEPEEESYGDEEEAAVTKKF